MNIFSIILSFLSIIIIISRTTNKYFFSIVFMIMIQLW